MATPVGGRLASALRDTVKAAGITQSELAEAMGVDQTTVSTWVRGMRRIPLDALPELEETMGVTVGTLLRKAGYVSYGGDVVSAVAADPALNDSGRQAVIAVYEALVLSAKATNRAASPRAADSERSML